MGKSLSTPSGFDTGTTSESSRERGPMSGRKDLFDLTGKVAIVTGSTKGIGRAMAEGLAHAGATVVVSSRKQDLCEEVAEQISITTGSEVVGIACHVGDWEQVPYFVDTVRDQLGRIDVLVNNAGINPARTTIEDMPIDLWKKVFNVNLEGPLRTSQLIAPIMRDQGGGSIINIASMGGYSGGAPISPYCASKAALINLTKSMAQAWAPWNVQRELSRPRSVYERDGRGSGESFTRVQGTDRGWHVAKADRGPT